MCEQWKEFDTFLSDVGERPNGALLMRKSEALPYQPGNVEWVRAGDRCKPRSAYQKQPLYTLWQGMVYRCHRPAHPFYSYYGARGISVCDWWRIPRGIGYRNFLADMGPRPDGYTLDRIDNDGNYEPDNCRWASRRTQQRNRRVNVFLTIDGRRYKAIDLSDISGLKTDTIVARAKKGLSFQEVIAPEARRDLSGLELARNLTHCRRGHEYTEENTYRSPAGARQCRACNQMREKARER